MWQSTSQHYLNIVGFFFKIKRVLAWQYVHKLLSVQKACLHAKELLWTQTSGNRCCPNFSHMTCIYGVTICFSLTVGMLQDHQVSIATRLKYLDKVVTTVACFVAGHRVLYKTALVNMDVSYRKLRRQIVRPPPGTNSALEWHKIFHWNERFKHFAAVAGGKSWSQSVCTYCWKFVRYVVCLPSQ